MILHVRHVGLLTGIGVARSDGRNRALAREWLKLRVRAGTAYAFCDSLKTFDGSTDIFKKTPKSIYAYNRARFASLRDTQVAAPRMRSVIACRLFAGLQTISNKPQKSINA